MHKFTLFKVVNLQVQIGQRMDLEIDRDEIMDDERKSVIATWYHLGNVIYIELTVNKNMLKEIRKLFSDKPSKSQIFSITRLTKMKYLVEPTMVLLKKTN